MRYVLGLVRQTNNVLTGNARSACTELVGLHEKHPKPVTIAGWSMGAAMACLAYKILSEERGITPAVYLYGPVVPRHIEQPRGARVIFLKTDLIVKYVGCVRNESDVLEVNVPGGHDVSALRYELHVNLMAYRPGVRQRGGKRSALVVSDLLPSRPRQKRSGSSARRR